MTQIPAPEEVRTWKDYVTLFRSLNPGENIGKVAHCSGMTLKAWFEHCWQQPEAEMIHAAHGE